MTDVSIPVVAIAALLSFVVLECHTDTVTIAVREISIDSRTSKGHFLYTRTLVVLATDRIASKIIIATYTSVLLLEELVKAATM